MGAECVCVCVQSVRARAKEHQRNPGKVSCRLQLHPFVFPQLLSFTPCLCIYSTQSSSMLASAASVAFQVYCCFGEMKHFSLIEVARNKDRKLEPGGRGWRGTVRGMTPAMIWCDLTSTDGAEQTICETKQFKQKQKRRL